MVENIKWYGGMNMFYNHRWVWHWKSLECIRAALLMVDDSTKRQSGNQRCLGEVEQQKWVTSRQNVGQFSLLSGVGQIPALCFSRQNAGTWILILHSPHPFRMERTDLDSSQKFNFVFLIPHCPIVSPYVPVKATQRSTKWRPHPVTTWRWRNSGLRWTPQRRLRHGDADAAPQPSQIMGCL